MYEPNKYRPKMSREDRAKQFMPFSALKGYEEALRKAEALSDNKFNNQIIHSTDEETNVYNDNISNNNPPSE